MTILYRSTRTDPATFAFDDVILHGLAPDGGLFVPASLPRIGQADLAPLRDADYRTRVGWLLERFETGIPADALDDMLQAAYGANFDDPAIAPVVSVDDATHVLELWHGPSAAFKDMALQLMPRFFNHALAKTRSAAHALRYLILTATSGDTGKAALEGFRDQPDVAIMVFYPRDGVSAVQERQMLTQGGDNVHVVGVRGDFDDCQRLVKTLFADETLAASLRANYDTALSSANSINWGRLLPQMAFHLHGYLELVRSGRLAPDQPLDIVVPSGNFGNILAAFYLREMGLPLGRLICASNRNDVLTEFVRTGRYDLRTRKLRRTLSPSMDILVSSNVERLLHLLGADGIQVDAWLRMLRDDRYFELPAALRERLTAVFAAYEADDAETLLTISDVYTKHRYLTDPHTAVAFSAARRHREAGNGGPLLIASTAHWAKFGDPVFRAVFPDQPTPEDTFETLDVIAAQPGVAPVPATIRQLQEAPVRHRATIPAQPAAAIDVLKTFLQTIGAGQS